MYFGHCLRDIARIRRQLVSAQFHDALTRGSRGQRAIETARSYDPVRYVGDMLAWIHERATCEKDSLTAFLGLQMAPGTGSTVGARSALGSTKGGPFSPSSRVAEQESRKDLTSRGGKSSTIGDRLREEMAGESEGLLADLASLIDFVLEGLVDGFKNRMESLLNGGTEKETPFAKTGTHMGMGVSGGDMAQHLPLLAYYKIAQLCLHFGKTMSDLLHTDNGLVRLLDDMQKRLSQQFLDLCNQHSQQMREDAQTDGSYDFQLDC